MSAGCANLLVIGVAVLCYYIGYHEGKRAWREVEAATDAAPRVRKNAPRRRMGR